MTHPSAVHDAEPLDFAQLSAPVGPKPPRAARIAMRTFFGFLLIAMTCATAARFGRLDDIAFRTAAWLTPGQLVRGSGVAATEQRDVSGFSQIKLETDGELLLAQDGTESLEVEADDNILPLIETIVRGDTLTIKMKSNTNIFSTKTPIRYTVSVAEIDNLDI